MRTILAVIAALAAAAAQAAPIAYSGFISGATAIAERPNPTLSYQMIGERPPVFVSLFGDDTAPSLTVSQLDVYDMMESQVIYSFPTPFTVDFTSWTGFSHQGEISTSDGPMTVNLTPRPAPNGNWRVRVTLQTPVVISGAIYPSDPGRDDFQILSSSISIPEPAAWVMGACASLVFWRRASRRR